MSTGSNVNTKKKGSGIAFVLPGSAGQMEGDAAPVKPAGEEVLRSATAQGPRTGVGLLTKTVFETSRLENQVAELRAELDRAMAAQGAQPFDPRLIVQSRWANRHPDSFSDAKFEELLHEIQEAGGNVQPIKLRPLASTRSKDGEGPRYEIVYGHRRHHACLRLGLPVYAVVQQLDDQGLFVQMERENRGHKSLSAWEQGRMYLRAIEEGLFPSNAKLAAEINRDVADVGKAIRVAKLPSEITSAFPSPNSIQFMWIANLEAALRDHSDKVMAIAREIGGQTSRPTAKEVFLRLTAVLNDSKKAKAKGASLKLEVGKGRVVKIQRDAKGRTVLELPAGLVPEERWTPFQDGLRKLLE